MISEGRQATGLLLPVQKKGRKKNVDQTETIWPCALSAAVFHGVNGHQHRWPHLRTATNHPVSMLVFLDGVRPALAQHFVALGLDPSVLIPPDGQPFGSEVPSTTRMQTDYVDTDSAACYRAVFVGRQNSVFQIPDDVHGASSLEEVSTNEMDQDGSPF